MVSSIFKHNMYSGVFENLDPLDTPVNLFENDGKWMDLMRDEDIYESKIKKGGCLFIPSYYWY